jgi:hypothetical protein
VWVAEPGEDYDNQIQPSFATIKGAYLNDTDPLSTLDALSLLFSDNWYDSNFGNSERFLLITSALELVFINALIDKGAGTESAFKLYRDGDISGAQASGYLGTLKGSWKLVKIHPEFLPKVFTDTNLVVDPVAHSGTAARTLRQVIALAAYKNSIQTYEHFSEKRQQDGGTRFKGTEYVQDFSYDCWVIDQMSEGEVPLFMPAVATVPGRQRLVHLRRRSGAAARAQRASSRSTTRCPARTFWSPGPSGSPGCWYRRLHPHRQKLTLASASRAGDVAHNN